MFHNNGMLRPGSEQLYGNLLQALPFFIDFNVKRAAANIFCIQLDLNGGSSPLELEWKPYGSSEDNDKWKKIKKGSSHVKDF